MRVKTNEAMFDIKDDVMDSEKMDTKADPVSHWFDYTLWMHNIIFQAYHAKILLMKIWILTC